MEMKYGTLQEVPSFILFHLIVNLWCELCLMINKELCHVCRCVVALEKVMLCCVTLMRAGQFKKF